MQNDVDAIIDQGIEFLEEGNLPAAEETLAQAQKLVGESHVRVLHLAGLLAGAEGNLQVASGYLMQAVDKLPNIPEIYFDCADCLRASGQDLSEAEAVVRMLLNLESLDEESIFQAKLMLAQIRLDDEDAEEALEILEEILENYHEHPVFLSTKAMIFEDQGRSKDAIKCMEKAIAVEPEDADLHYQLGLIHRMEGNQQASIASMLKVLELDLEDEDFELEPIQDQEEQALRAYLEEVFEELPEEVIPLVAHVPIKIQDRATREQVAKGMDPRAWINFVGQPKSADFEARLEAILVMRDPLLEEINDEDEIPGMLAVGLLEELRGFFRIEDLEIASPV